MTNKSTLTQSALTIGTIFVTALVTLTVSAGDGDAATPKAQVLCVKKDGSVFARVSCKSGEILFSVMPGTVATQPLTAIRLSNSSSPAVTPLASNISTLSVLSATPRVFTQLVTLPVGLSLSRNAEFPNATPTCPADAPLQTSWFIDIAPNATSSNINGQVTRSDSSVNEVYYTVSNVAGTRVTNTYQPSVSQTTSSIQSDILINISFDQSLHKLRFYALYGASGETVGIGGFDPSKPFNNLIETIDDSTILDFDLSFYVSVTCIPTVNLIPQP